MVLNEESDQLEDEELVLNVDEGRALELLRLLQREGRAPWLT